MGVAIEKLTHPYSLTQKNYNKNGWSFFFFFLVNFLTIFWFFSFFSSLFHYFFLFFSMVFLKSGGIYRGVRKMGGWYTNATFPLLPPHQSFFCIFFISSPIFVTVWRPFWVSFSSKFICTESSRCIVSNVPSITQFGATVVEISCPEGMWC